MVVRYAARINGLDALALTKLDVLDGLDELKICTGYRIGGRVVSEFPADLAASDRREAVYDTLPGWQEPTRGARDFDELPDAARRYGPKRRSSAERTWRPKLWTLIVVCKRHRRTRAPTTGRRPDAREAR